MKTSLIGLCAAFLSLSLLNAQRALELQLSSDLKPAPKQFGEGSEADQKLVISKVALLLGQHVTFRKDGVAATYFDSPHGKHFVEMKNLRIKMVLAAPLRADGQSKGITKRVQALFTFDNARVLDSKTNRWSGWGPQGHPLFPAAFDVFWKNGHPIIDGGDYLAKFRKGPIVTQRTAIAAPDKPANVPGAPPTQGGFERGTGTGGLPPGMKRK